MSSLLVLPHENLIEPHLIKGVIKFPGKGVALRNEFNKILDFIPEKDERRQRIIVKVLEQIIKVRNRSKPNWDVEFATAP